MRVLVLKGGISDEREVSLRSATAVSSALRIKGHVVEEYDTNKGLDQILNMLSIDIIFPVLHGLGGEDGVVQKFLEEADLPFVGSGSVASELCFDKAKFKKMIAQAGILTPESQLIGKEFITNHHILAKQPFVLKPFDGGSSIDTYIVRDPSKSPVEADVFDRHEYMLLEELVEGVEITVGVLGNEALPVVEIIPPENAEFDYENKYNGKTQEICPAKSLDESTQIRAQRLAEQVHKLVGARHLSRTDIIVTPEGQMFVLELNTIPGMTDQSLFPRAAKAAGIEMPELVDQLIAMALTDAKSAT